MSERPSLLRMGAVSSSHALATEVGVAVLRDGGNAVDAAAAVQCTLGVVEPLASGLGGGAFWLLYWAEDERIYAVDSRETAPAAATADIFIGPDGDPLDDNDRAATGLAVAVPGALLGLDEVLRRFGTMGLPAALTPAIRAASAGVPVSKFMAGRLGLGSLNNRARLQRSPSAAAMFLPAGEPLKAGDLLVQSDLAATLENIVTHGIDAFYRGAVGKAIVDEVRERGGRMTMDDLASYRTVWREPLIGTYGDHTIATFGPPGSGVTLLQMLALLRRTAELRPPSDATEHAHVLLEIMRCTFADRVRTLGDPAHVAVPVRGLLHEQYLAQRWAEIDLRQAQEHWDGGDPWKYETGAKSASTPLPHTEGVGSGQTTHFTVSDRWGNVVAVTATIESLFGSGIMVPGTGLLLNNQMSDFNERPRGPNQVRPGARPVSSMAPTLVLREGRPVLTLGSPGGATIVPSILQVLGRVLDAGQSLEDAVAAPRLYVGPGRRVTWEDGVGEDLRDALSERGHLITKEPRTIGNVQSIAIDWEAGSVKAVADPRRQGSAEIVEADNQ